MGLLEKFSYWDCYCYLVIKLLPWIWNPGMEPDVREFLVRIMQTISMSIVWLLVNMTLGIYFDLPFSQAILLFGIAYSIYGS